MFRQLIADGCAAWGLSVSEGALARMEDFSRLLIQKNRVMNLTAITEPEEIATRHMLDCLFLLTCADFSGKRVLDIGCGAGFPSVPLACFEPEMDITALDSTQKRITFLQECAQALPLPRLSPVAGRAEEWIAGDGRRAGFDIVVSRAVAPLSLLCELCLPYVAPGGLFLPLKSCTEQAESEIAAAARAIATLGGVLEGQMPYTIAGLEQTHQVLRIVKKKATPAQYPRRWGKMSQAPL